MLNCTPFTSFIIPDCKPWYKEVPIWTTITRAHTWASCGYVLSTNIVMFIYDNLFFSEVVIIFSFLTKCNLGLAWANAGQQVGWPCSVGLRLCRAFICVFLFSCVSMCSCFVLCVTSMSLRAIHLGVSLVLLPALIMLTRSKLWDHTFCIKNYLQILSMSWGLSHLLTIHPCDLNNFLTTDGSIYSDLLWLLSGARVMKSRIDVTLGS